MRNGTVKLLYIAPLLRPGANPSQPRMAAVARRALSVCVLPLVAASVRVLTMVLRAAGSTVGVAVVIGALL